MHARNSGYTVETYRVETLLRTKLRDTKTGCYQLAWFGAGVVGIAEKSEAGTGEIDYLALRKGFFNVRGELNEPWVTQSLLCSFVSGCLHYKLLAKSMCMHMSVDF